MILAYVTGSSLALTRHPDGWLEAIVIGLALAGLLVVIMRRR